MAIAYVIFNGRGEVHIEAKVTPRMMPGVVALGEGAWYNPDANRIDSGGLHQRSHYAASIAAGEGQPIPHKPRSG